MHLQPRHVFFFGSFEPRIFIGIDRYAQEFNTFVFELFVVFFEVDDFFPTRTAPRSPEIHQHDFPFEVGEREHLAVDLRVGECRCWITVVETLALGFGFCDVVFIFLYGRITGVCGRQIVQCIVDKRFVVFLA